MTVQYNITPDELEYLIRMVMAILEEQKNKIHMD